ncbi:DUF3617 domain-containing protein [Sphingorhabdus sp. Alg239-R122]|uniref:DUF3617 domain-containing protein n=1 Tax=Sphingorhabdus sp. Alg239-R122 TaxID=2305989 RepID=UPI0013DBE11E|nr:DUF3617 domain-containing protein [Sphingorhabdus sp. Alg239-R122]
MKKLILSAAAIGLLAGCSDKGADTDGDGKISTEEVAAEMNTMKLQPGEWENTVEVVDVKIENLPEGAPAGIAEMMKGRKNSVKQCITEEKAANPGAEFFAAQKDANCDVKEFNISGGKIKSEMSCAAPAGQGEGKMTMKMDGDYAETSYDMNMNMVATAPGTGMNMNITSKVTGKRIGDCPS